MRSVNPCGFDRCSAKAVVVSATQGRGAVRRPDRQPRTSGILLALAPKRLAATAHIRSIVIGGVPLACMNTPTLLPQSRRFGAHYRLPQS